MAKSVFFTEGGMRLARWRFGKTALGLIALMGGVDVVFAAPTANEPVQQTLSNGLQVVLLEDHWHPLVALEVCYRVGSRHDPSGKHGLAHLLEHLTFHSLSRLPEEYSPRTARPERAGATTNHDTTCYSSRLLRSELETALVVERERMATLRINAHDLDRAKTIVMKERRQLVEGDTWRNLLEEVDSAAFRLHPYRFPTSGWPETLAQVLLDDVRTHFTPHYSPGNAVVVAVGDFHSAELLSLINRTVGQVPARALPPVAAYVEPAQEGERRILFAPLAAPRLVYAYHVPAFGHPDQAALEVTSVLLSGSDQARLPALLYPHQLADVVDTEYNPLTHDPGLFYIKVALGSRANFSVTEETIDDVLWHLREDGLRPGELERAKKRLLLHFSLDHSLSARASYLAQYISRTTLTQVQRYPDIIRAVTEEDVQRVVHVYLSPNNRVVGITGMAQQEESHSQRRAEGR